MNISTSDKMVFYMGVAILFLAIIFAVLNGLIQMALSTNEIVLKQTERRAMESRMLYSPNCLAYTDQSSGRVYSNFNIDPAKITIDTVQNCIGYVSSAEPAVSVELRYWNDKGEPISVTAKTISWGTARPTGELRTNSYPVNVKEFGPGVITFTHRT